MIIIIIIVVIIIIISMNIIIIIKIMILSRAFLDQVHGVQLHPFANQAQNNRNG